MPTPVSTARQCLTLEATQELDDAVLVARRRAHAQTTSLHLVSALLSRPSSALREACGRARNNAYSSRIQFKALELCLGVSLDRLPSSPNRIEEPPVSNSFMAAIKRSQANQRRQPENFHFYQQQQQSSSSSISIVKVELQNLVLSILDDPVVSRVFGDAGFRSCDIKLAILRPVHQLFRYSRYKGPPMYLCNLAGDSGFGGRGFSFPFLGFPGFFEGGENCRRIGEILVRKQGRNPLLVGVYANDALRNFIEMVQRRTGGNALPVELSGLSLICVQNEILKFLSDNSNEGLLKSAFEEVGRTVEHCKGPGVVVNFGDLNPLIVDDVSVTAVSYVFRELAKLLEIHGRKVWLIGATARYETYLKCLNKFPSIEKDWDLQLLPITSLGPSSGEPYPRSSLMESFVPFGGFFSMPSDIRSPLSHSYQFVSRCHLCNEKCEQEVAALSKGILTASVADHCQSSLPSWLQMAEINTNNGLDAVKAKDDCMVLSTKVAGLEKKWDDICQRLHYTQPLPKIDTYQVGSEVPAVVGFQVVENKKDNANDYSSSNANASSNESGRKNKTSWMEMDLQLISSSKASSPLGVVSESMNMNYLSKSCEGPSKTEEELGSLRSRHSLSSSSAGDGHTSPTSATSVTTDLGLGMYSSSAIREQERPKNQRNIHFAQDFSGCFSAKVDAVTESIANHPAQYSSSSKFHGHYNQKDFKMLYSALCRRVDWQQEAISVISQAIVHCRTRNEKHHGASRGDIWFNFLGPDRFGKRKITIAIAEILCGGRENFVSVNLNFQDVMSHTTIFDHQAANGCDVKFRGKTVVDYIADELRKKPLSVVLLESIDKADLVAQNSLSQAVKTGHFSDSRGREVGISNAIFVTTSNITDDSEVLNSAKEATNYSEDSISKAKVWPIQISITFSLTDSVISHCSGVLSTERKGSPRTVLLNKRKLTGSNETVEHHETSEIAKRAHKASLMCLDLNLPAEESEMCSTDGGISDSESVSEASKAWLEDFYGQCDETIVFKPFDFDALAEKILQEITECFRRSVGLECLLEIDSKVMEQILAAACLSSISGVEDWIQQVLSRGFVEAQEIYNLTAHSIVKLVTCEGLFPTEQAPGVFLPARIILN